MYFPRYGSDRHQLWKINGTGEITLEIYRVGLWFLCIALPLTAIYLYTKFHFNLLCTFQDMARTGNHYEKWLRGDNSINIQGRIMVLVHCPSPYCHLSINHVSFKSQQQLFARQDTEPTDGRTDKAATTCFPLCGT